jgi:hypothetical protein
MGLASCALAARTSAVAGSAAAGGLLGGPVGAGVGAGVALLGVEAYQGEVLGGEVKDAALAGSAPPALSLFGFLDRNWWWMVMLVLVFTPSGQYLFGKLKKRFANTRST